MGNLQKFNLFLNLTWETKNELWIWSSAPTKVTKSPNSLATRTARAETKARRPKNLLSSTMSFEKSSATPPLNESEKGCKTSSKPRNEPPSTKFKKIFNIIFSSLEYDKFMKMPIFF